MSERRALRLIVEVAFLAALAAALTFADLRTYETVGVMLLGWLLVAVFEWGALRSRPHYASGLPPRWYVPRVTLPPPRPLEQFSSGYPAAEAGGDAPTWIASPAMLAEWPVADVEPAVEAPADEQTQAHDVFELELSVAVAEDAAEGDPGDVGAEPDLPDEADPEPELEPEPEPDPEPDPEAEAPPRRAPVLTIDIDGGARTARHRIDPLAEPAQKSRRFGKRPEQVTHDVLVPDGPPAGRLLPIQARGKR